MTLWFVLALMTVAAIFAVLWPLSRQHANDGPPDVAADLAVYRDQLDEIDRDRASGRLPMAEAEAARTEIARRLLAANAAARGTVTQRPTVAWRRRAAMLVALVALPLGAAGLYLALGSPSLPGEPLAAREAAPTDKRSIGQLVAEVERHLASHPDDGRGWEVVAPVYMRLGRFDDAVKARRNILRLSGESAARQSDLGEALVAAADGVVTAEAKSAFDRSLALDAKDVRARYFLGLAAEQDGRREDAVKRWQGLLADAPEDAGWRGLVEQSIVRASAPSASGAGPSAQDAAAAEGLPANQRNAMIRGMVERLAERLEKEGGDVDDWIKLIRAYGVLGESDKAKATVVSARKALAGDEDKMRRVDEFAKTLGLGG
jgi:cytochrome c-type biogenesis protein CcmH